MLIAVLSDIHGNRHAFEAVLDACAEVDEIWCLGDIVGYGAEPDDCCELARENCDVILSGNHDLAVTGELSLDEFSPSAAIAAQWTRETLDPASLRFLESLRPSAEHNDIGLFHASPRDPVWEYVLSALLAELCFDTFSDRIGFVGHSHVPLSFHRPDGAIASGATRKAGDSFDIGSGRWLINPGSVGQPRDGDPRAAWLELDTDRWNATWHRVPYDIEGAQTAIRAAKLPASLAERLEYGQ